MYQFRPFHLFLLSILNVISLSCCTEPNPDFTDVERLQGGDLLVAGETSAGETSAGETSAGETSAGETSAGETPAGETSAGETSAGETSAGETSAGETSAGETSAGETSAGETSAGEISAGGQPPCLSPQDCDNDGTASDLDCDDYDPSIFPGAPELCDGVDNSCNGEVDEVISSCYTGSTNTLGLGVCQAGLQRCIDEALSACEMEITPTEERCDETLEVGLDDDCDGSVDEGCDLDMDQVTVDEGDCNDRDPLISPNQPESCNGVDDDCNGQVDEISISCYSGPDDTQGVGTCRNGVRQCVDQGLSDCQGEVIPTEEICGDDIDNNCDGEVDEDCNLQACSVVNRNIPVIMSTTCLTAGTFARNLVQVTPRLLNGDPLPADVTLSLNTQPALNIVNEGQEDGTWYWELFAPSSPMEVNLSVQVNCEDDQQTTLTQRPTLQVVPRISLEQRGAPFTIGGCDAPSGNLYVEVKDSQTAEPIVSASIMIGDSPSDQLQLNAAASIRGEAGSTNNYFLTNSRGRYLVRDFNGALSSPTTLTLGAEGYENMSLFNLEGGHVVAYLQPLSHTDTGESTNNRFELTGTVNDFNNLSNDGDTDLSLVLPSLSLESLTSKPITQLLSRFECWRPVIISPEVLIPGNLYVPGQNELLFRVSQHRYRIQDHDRSQDHIIALSGKVNTRRALDILASGSGSAADLLSEVTFKEIGVRLNTPFTEQGQGDVLNQAVPLSIDLNESLATCTVSGVPAGSYASCISAGEWTEAGIGTGRVFPMGITNFPSSDFMNGSSVTRTISHAPLVGELSNIYYLSSALAIPEGDDPDLRNASSSIIDRQTLGSAGGQLSFNGFLGLVSDINRAGQTLSWSDVTSATTTDVDACNVSLFVTQQLGYNPGNCSGSLGRASQSPLWSAYLPGSQNSITYPTLPSSWPRANVAGLLSDAELAPNEAITVRVRCAQFEQEFSERFSNIIWRDLTPTHVTTNQVLY